MPYSSGQLRTAALTFLQINNPTIVNAATVVEAQSSGFDASQTSFGGKHLRAAYMDIDLGQQLLIGAYSRAYV